MVQSIVQSRVQVLYLPGVLQKQVGCSNHRVVTLVAYKLQKQVGCSNHRVVTLVAHN